MKYRFKLNGLDCPNCASKIEVKLNNDKNIRNASVNFSKLTVSLETDLKSDVKKYVSDIVKSIEPDVIVLDIKEEVKNNNFKYNIFRLLLGIVLLILGMIFKGNVSSILIILSYIILLSRTFVTAIKLLFKKILDENFLVTISCIGAYFTNNIHEGAMVIILYEIGKVLEQIAVNRSRRSISDLMDIKADEANLKVDGEIKVVNPESVNIGDIIVVKSGEKIPLDGVIVKGSSKLNTSALTGESKLKSVDVGDTVLSGEVNMGDIFEMKVSCLYENSTVSRILELVENATDRKAKTETFVSKAAKVYTPVILILSILTAFILPLFGLSMSDAIYRALVFLVVSCPCAIAISVPLSYFSGIGSCSKNGILVKGSDYLDLLSDINQIIFDKTGTLTKGSFKDYTLTVLDSSKDKDDIIKYYLMGEKLSNHPIAKSILSIFDLSVSTKNVKNFKEISGKGISYKYNQDTIKIGSSSYIGIKDNDQAIYLSINDKVCSKLMLIDGLKEDAKEVIEKLNKRGIVTKMFTGDNNAVALDISKKLGIEKTYYELLPEDKYKLLENEIGNGVVAFVGDGINDAPSLALSDIGISMGGIGSASAIEASDVVIMTDELSKIISAIDISKFTKKVIKQNLLFAIIVKVLVLVLSTLGIASMWQAVFADTGVTLLTILNSTRILKRK